MTFAQLAAQIESYQPVLNFGLGAAMAFYLLHVVVKRLDKIDHRLVGLNRVMLIELIGRESLSVAAKAQAREELEKLNFRAQYRPKEE